MMREKKSGNQTVTFIGKKYFQGFMSKFIYLMIRSNPPRTSTSSSDFISPSYPVVYSKNHYKIQCYTESKKLIIKNVS